VLLLKRIVTCNYWIKPYGINTNTNVPITALVENICPKVFFQASKKHFKKSLQSAFWIISTRVMNPDAKYAKILTLKILKEKKTS